MNGGSYQMWRGALRPSLAGCHARFGQAAEARMRGGGRAAYNPQVMPNIRVMHYGLGPIGAAIVKQVAARPGFKIVGAIDIDPAKVGRDLGDVVGLPKRIGVKVWDDAARALKAAKADVVVLCTSSSIKTVMPQIEMILKSKTAIVSTTEELSYPGYTHIRLARQIHTMAKKAKVGVLGTGVNPGFAMDALPIALTAVCERVDRVVVNRIQDARIRRLPFQQKIGAGLTTEQFQKKVDDRQRAARRPDRIDRDDCRRARLDAGSDHRRHSAEARRGDDLERVSGGRSRLRVRHHPGWRRLSEEGAGHQAAHGGVPRVRPRPTTRSTSKGHQACR